MIKKCFQYIIIIAIGVPVFGYINNFFFPYEPIPLPKQKTRIESIESQFHVWDGSHIRLEKLIIDSLNDPGSYEHIETRYKDMGNHLVVSTAYRGKNAFGAIIKNKTIAKVSVHGIILGIVPQ